MFQNPKQLKIGSTGSSETIAPLQLTTMKKVVKRYFVDHRCEYHNGCCINGDEELLKLMQQHVPEENLKTVFHPPTNKHKMFDYTSYRRKGDQVRTPLPYLKRNMQIVAESNYLIATPKSVNEELRSGTWATIRYARIAEMPIMLIFPNGSMRIENKEKWLV